MNIRCIFLPARITIEETPPININFNMVIVMVIVMVMVINLKYHNAICFAYMEATVVGGSVDEGKYPAIILTYN